MSATEKITIQALARNPKTSNPEKIRKLGQLPAVLYGQGAPTQSLAVTAAEFEKIFKKAGESTIVQLQTPDGKTHSVLIHDVQKHYLTLKPWHVDFFEVSMTKKLKAKVPLEFTGESKAVKELGGVLVKILNEVEVECLPQDLPHNILVDISTLKAFSDSITIKTLQVDGKVKVLTPGEETIAKVQAPREIEELEQKPVEDVSAVEGAAEEKPEAAKDKEAGEKEPKTKAESPKAKTEIKEEKVKKE